MVYLNSACHPMINKMDKHMMLHNAKRTETV